MTCYLEFRWGDSVHQPSLEQMRQALAELDEIDPEHPDTWLTHGDTGWTLSAHEGGSLIWEKVEDVDSPPGPRHMNGVSRDRVLELWSKLAAGKVEEIEEQPWCPGTGRTPLTAVELAAIESYRLASERRYYESLGVEGEDARRCKAPDCSRGAVRLSIFCRTHHYENVCHRPCPFTH